MSNNKVEPGPRSAIWRRQADEAKKKAHDYEEEGLSIYSSYESGKADTLQACAEALQEPIDHEHCPICLGSMRLLQKDLDDIIAVVTWERIYEKPHGLLNAIKKLVTTNELRADALAPAPHNTGLAAPGLVARVQEYVKRSDRRQRGPWCGKPFPVHPNVEHGGSYNYCPECDLHFSDHLIAEIAVLAAADALAHAPADYEDDLSLARRKQSEMFEQLEACRAALRGDDVSASIHPLVHDIAKLRADALAPPEPGWQPIATAPPEGQFLVTDGRRQVVFDGKMLILSRKANTPQHLSGHHWTLWHALLPLPAPPRADALDAGPVEEAIHQIAEAIRTPVHSEATQDGDHFTHRLSVGADALDAPPKDKVKE